MITKQCSKCHQDKPTSQFRKQTGTKDGFQYECVSCMDERARARYQAKKDELLERNKKWQAENKDKHKAAALKHYKSDAATFQRKVHQALQKTLGKLCPSAKELTSASGKQLYDHIFGQNPNLKLEDYGETWLLDFVAPLDKSLLKTLEGQKQLFYYRNLRPREKTVEFDVDFGVTLFDDNIK